MEETKICIACREEKTLDNFYFRNENGKYRGACKQCKSVRTKAEISASLNSPTKICKTCGEEKLTSEFQKAGGGKWLQPYCKPCDAKRKRKHLEENMDKIVAKRREYYQVNKELVQERNEAYREKNKELVEKRSKAYRERTRDEKRAKDKAYRVANREKLNAQSKAKYRTNIEVFKERAAKQRANRTPEQMEGKKQYDREYKEKNREALAAKRKAKIEKIRVYRRDYQERKLQESPEYRLLKNLRSRLRFALKGKVKTQRTRDIIGCTVEEFRAYIEAQFKDGMCWGNYGRYGWHIDHKIPVSWFDLSNPNCLKLAFHYTNHQPLYSEDNLKKNNKYHNYTI